MKQKRFSSATVEKTIATFSALFSVAVIVVAMFATSNGFTSSEKFSANLVKSPQTLAVTDHKTIGDKSSVQSKPEQMPIFHEIDPSDLY